MSDEMDDVLGEAQAGKVAPIYLLWGEEFLVRKGADELVKRLLPDASVGLNLAIMDGGSPREIAQELATLPLFPGTKLVLVRDPEFLAPKKGRGDPLARARDAWKAGRRKEGARRVLALAARAGWGVGDLDPAASGAPSVDQWREELGVELADADVAFLGEVAAFCRDENITAPESDATALLTLFEAGVPRGHSLILAATDVDPKNPLVKVAEKLGHVVVRKVPQAKRGKADLSDVAAELLEPLGKRLGPGALELLQDRVGGNMRLLQSELEKLAIYSDAKVITADEVRLLVGKVREDEYPELADALQRRDLGAALKYVDDALGQGTHGLMVLGAIASILRTMIQSSEGSRKYGDVSRMSAREFEAKVFPNIERDAKAAGRKVPHPYAAYMAAQASGRYGRNELLDAIVACADADLALKSSGNQRLVLEGLLFKVVARRGS